MSIGWHHCKVRESSRKQNDISRIESLIAVKTISTRLLQLTGDQLVKCHVQILLINGLNL